MSEISMRRSDILQLARNIYVDGPPFGLMLRRARPLICPFEILVDFVPVGARVLDIGCGAGLFLAILTAAGRIRGGVGLDVNSNAIALARLMASRLPSTQDLVFEALEPNAPWPEERFEVVSMIDVAHHVPVAAQQRIVERGLSHVAPDGRFIFKDIAVRPRWRAAANQLHDLLLARQWVHHVRTALVIDWAGKSDFRLTERRSVNQVWYRHEILVLDNRRSD